jgi:hypothetical protein
MPADVSFVPLLGSGLSFLGVGAQEPAPDWGAMVAGADGSGGRRRATRWPYSIGSADPGRREGPRARRLLAIRAPASVPDGPGEPGGSAGADPADG